MSKSLSFHEQTGIIVPGATLVFGLLFFFPEFRQLFFYDGVSLGGLGLFLLISYAAGHLAAALGNLVEAGIWGLGGGRPVNWVIQAKDRLLSSEQIDSLENLIRQRLRLEIPAIRGMTPRQWLPISRQIYADVIAHGKSAKIDSFNGIYGLNRGLAAALLALVLLSLAFSETDWRVTLGLLPIAIIYLFRMYRFGISYASELYCQFLLLPPQPPIAKRLSNVTRLPVS
ncbi:MAG TPA: hypothetical protein VFA50_15320 [Stellaceae bacterium]|nr:hypothetical protein [Stellaceae bacterium]